MPDQPKHHRVTAEAPVRAVTHYTDEPERAAGAETDPHVAPAARKKEVPAPEADDDQRRKPRSK